MKRWMLLLAVLLVLAFVAPACVPTTGGPEVVGEKTTAPEPTEWVEATKPPVTKPTGEVISFWTWASTDFEEDALNRMVQQFRENTGIEVELLIIR